MQKIMAFFGFIHFCIIVILGSRFAPQFPLLSRDYFRGLSVPPISPRFMFVLGNAIVIILFLKSSGKSLAKDGFGRNEKVDFSEYAKNQNEECKKQGIQSKSVSVAENKIRRSQSENLARTRRRVKEPDKELRLPATFTCRKRDVAATDEMSNEEFRLTVEAFIARQQRSLRDEELTSVLVPCES